MKKYIKPAMEMADVEMTSTIMNPAISAVNSQANGDDARTKEEVDWNDGSFWGE